MPKEISEEWPELKSIIKITRQRTAEDKRFAIQEKDEEGKISYRVNDNDMKITKETTYYLSSRLLAPREALRVIRSHWGIENKLHWILDTAFLEDDWLVTTKKLARSLGLLRRVAINIIKKSKTTGSTRRRMKRAAWNESYLEGILGSYQV